MSMQVYFILALTAAASAQELTPPAEVAPPDEQILFAELPKVEAATLHAQTLAEAPANVSVITAKEIRQYGYRTLGEALNSVRGFYMTYDHMYHYVGVRGFSLPGDFNTRFLVMLNGHPLTDNIYNANSFFGDDFGLDMDLVERIEIIRGPTSALYGSNGMLANINVVTRSPVDSERLRMSVETSTFGERKAAVASSVYLGHGANLLVSGSVFNNHGISFPLAGLELLPGVQSPVSNADGERGYHSFANLIWHNWSFTGFFNARVKQFPVGIGTSYAGDPGQITLDSRNVVDAIYKRTVGPGQLQWRIAYDQYRYRDRFDYPGNEEGEFIDAIRDVNNGDWLNSQVAYDVRLGALGPFTSGVQGFWELRNQQYNLIDGEVSGGVIDRPDRGIALFAQQQFDLSARWKLHAGIRFDQTRYFGKFLSPRVALVYQHSPRTVYKLVYGRPFRNPSTFEQFYNDGGYSYAAAPPLQHETADAFEASIERRAARNWTIILNGFHYRLQRVIEATTLANDVQQYQNGGTNLSTGVEFEVRAKLWDRLEALGSTAFQSTDREASGRLANAPRNVSKLRLGVPAGRLFLSSELRFVSARNAWTGDRLAGTLLADATATVRLHQRCDLQVGLRNALDRYYEDPIYLTVDRLRGDGRSAFLKLVWHVME